MTLTTPTPFISSGEFRGFDGEDFFFTNWHEVWTAVTTDGHLLAKHSAWILSRRKFVQQKSGEMIRISFDANPPIVETVQKKTTALVKVVFVSSLSWVLILSLFL